MKITELFPHNKLNEIKQNYGMTISKKLDSKIHSLMLLSNPFVSSQIKSKYSSLISNAVCSFLDHNPKEREISSRLHSFQMGITTNRKLMNTKQAITNFLNSSNKEKKGSAHKSKYNNYIHGPNPFDGLTIKSTKASYPKKTHRSSSSDNSETIMKRIRDFTSTINRPSNMMASTIKLSLKKDNNDLIKRSLINSSSLKELNLCIKSRINGNKYLDRGDDHIIDMNEDYKKHKTKDKEKEEDKEQCTITSMFNDMPLTDRLENHMTSIIHLSPIISGNECDTFSSFKSYLLLNSPNV